MTQNTDQVWQRWTDEEPKNPVTDFPAYVESLNTAERLKLHSQLCAFIAVDRVTDLELTTFDNVLAEEMGIEHEVFLESIEPDERADYEHREALEELLYSK